MRTTQLDIIRRQVGSSARNQVSGAQARLRRETSLVAQAGRWGADISRRAEDLARPRGRWFRGQTRPDLEPAGNTEFHPAEDGYLRRSPVQPVMAPRSYRRRRLLRAARIAGLVVLVLAGVWLLLRSGLLAF